MNIFKIIILYSYLLGYFEEIYIILKVFEHFLMLLNNFQIEILSCFDNFLQSYLNGFWIPNSQTDRVNLFLLKKIKTDLVFCAWNVDITCINVNLNYAFDSLLAYFSPAHGTIIFTIRKSELYTVFEPGPATLKASTKTTAPPNLCLKVSSNV